MFAAAAQRRTGLVLLFVIVVVISAAIASRADAASTRPTTPVEVVGQPIDVVGTLSVGGTVEIGNLPASQTVDGTVDVGNFPASQAVTGTVDVGNLPASQTVDGTVDVGNLPAVQDVRIVAGGGTAETVGGGTFRANSTFGPTSTSFVVPAGEYLKDLVVLDASTSSDCIFNFRTVPGDGTSTFSTPRGQELRDNPISLSTGLAGPLEVIVACGTGPDRSASGFYTTSTSP